MDRNQRYAVWTIKSHSAHLLHNQLRLGGIIGASNKHGPVEPISPCISEEAAWRLVKIHRWPVVEAAFQVLSEDAEKMGFSYSGFALTSLPHRGGAKKNRPPKRAAQKEVLTKLGDNAISGFRCRPSLG